MNDRWLYHVEARSRSGRNSVINGWFPFEVDLLGAGSICGGGSGLFSDG